MGKFAVSMVLILFVAVQNLPAQIDYTLLKQLRNKGIGNTKGNDENAVPSLDLANPLPLFGASGDINAAEGALPAQAMIDNLVDEQSYVLGSNDVITIYLWGTTNQVIAGTVNAEGFIYIPSIAMIDVRRCTLAQGKEKILTALQKVYKKVEITMSLTRLHAFRAYISGDVKNPGAYPVTGLTRVSDLIALAGGFKDEKYSRMREIEVANESYPIRYADMSLFYHGNSHAKNYYLIQGDHIFLKPRTKTIEIHGKVNYPGIYDYMADDKLKDIFAIAGGFSDGVDSSHIVLARFVNDKDSIQLFPLTASDSLYKIQPDDRIIVFGMPEYRVHCQIVVDGEVQRPGVYPIQEHKTTLRTVVEMAGGFTEYADLSSSKIIRTESKAVNDREFERLKTIPPEVMASNERLYLKSSLVEEDGKVSFSFNDYKDKAGSFILAGGDHIIVAKRSMAIQVSGAVKLPGLIAYQSGESPNYYVKQAGGFTKNAKPRSIKIMKNGMAILLKPSDASVLEPGDKIWVPEQDKRQNIRDVLDILGILSATTTIIVSIFAITSYTRR
jgi:polysaccharide biosynthesis/export protein